MSIKTKLVTNLNSTTFDDITIDILGESLPINDSLNETVNGYSNNVLDPGNAVHGTVNDLIKDLSGESNTNDVYTSSYSTGLYGSDAVYPDPSITAEGKQQELSDSNGRYAQEINEAYESMGLESAKTDLMTLGEIYGESVDTFLGSIGNAIGLSYVFASSVEYKKIGVNYKTLKQSIGVGYTVAGSKTTSLNLESDKSGCDSCKPPVKTFSELELLYSEPKNSWAVWVTDEEIFYLWSFEENAWIDRDRWIKLHNEKEIYCKKPVKTFNEINVIYNTPKIGWTIWVIDVEKFYYWDGSMWSDLGDGCCGIDESKKEVESLASKALARAKNILNF